ncbi:hypothetical protein K0M31_010113 [Melipona bicolor]|uniref:Uncharacterized protein n=1 Tax=Melipona bicolor TaxID=60889 RepID=A0AA40FN89_9HYME|nr:hypothetical protein K0M31_010113 [Melipona bicolor]
MQLHATACAHAPTERRLNPGHNPEFQSRMNERRKLHVPASWLYGARELGAPAMVASRRCVHGVLSAWPPVATLTIDHAIVSTPCFSG